MVEASASLWLAARPGSAQEIVRPSVRKNKQTQKNKQLTQEKQIRICFFKRKEIHAKDIWGPRAKQNN